MNAVIGIDGGGSETTAAVSTLEGEIIGFSRKGSLRLGIIGEKQAEETIEVALNY